jgi:hypothetical protein
MMLQCDECNMWRLLYCQVKLNSSEKAELSSIWDDFTFTCGVSLQDLEMEGTLADVYTRDLSCNNVVEKLYRKALLFVFIVRALSMQQVTKSIIRSVRTACTEKSSKCRLHCTSSYEFFILLNFSLYLYELP